MNKTRTVFGPWRPAGGFIALAAVFCCILLRAQDVTVYENLKGTRYGTFGALDFRGNPTEFGDEIALTGTARTVTKFIFDYYGNFVSSGDETARIRFYANDAPGIDLKPGNLLYDSGAFRIISGEATVSLDVPYVEVPNSFTWTVSFGGVTQTTGDSAELVVCDPPSVGAELAGGRIGSYWDYWKFNAGIWTSYMLTNNWHANFAAKVIAQEESINLRIALDQLTAQPRLRWAGKPGSQYQVQASADFVNWTDVAIVYGSEESFTELAIAPDPNQPTRIYRIAKRNLPSPPALASTRLGAAPGEIVVSWSGVPNIAYQIKCSENLKNWTYLGSAKTDADGKGMYLDKPPARIKARFYRVWSAW